MRKTITTVAIIFIAYFTNAQNTDYNYAFDNSHAEKWNCKQALIKTDYTFINRVEGAYNIDYIVDCNILVTGAATLTIKPGVVIEFRGAANGIVVQDNATLHIIGTEENGITLTTKQTDRGSWRGIVLNTKSNSNIVSYAVVENAGGTTNWFNGEKAGITILTKNASSSTTINNCRITNNGGYGVWVGKNQTLTSFTSNSICYNEIAGIAVFGNNVNALDNQSDYARGNGNQYIELMGVPASSGEASIVTDATLKALPIAYRVTKGNFVVKNSKLTIMPGVVMEFAPGTGLSTFEANSSNPVDGAIIATGTTEEHIVFRSINNEGTGTWKGIAILSASTDTKFIYCDISGGGAGNWLPIGGVAYGNITVYSRFRKASAIIQNCRICNSLYYGIAAKGSPNYKVIVNDDIATSNTFINNTSGEVLQ